MTGDRLKAALKKLKLTQKAFADEFQLSERTVRYYTAGGVTNTPTAVLIVLLTQGKITIPDIRQARRRM